MENEILNFSRVENDPFADLSLNVTNLTEQVNDYNSWQPTTLQTVMNYSYMFMELIKFFLAIGAILADILIIYLILRYKRLQKNFNMYILHYAIANAAYYIISPIFFLTHALFATGYAHFFHVYCYIGMAEISLLYMSFIFCLFLGLDWTISCFKPTYITKIRLLYNYKFIVLYSLFVLILILNCLSCIAGFELAHEIILFSMPAMVIALIVMHYFRRQKILSSEHLKTEYSLWIATIGIGCYVPIYFLDMIFRLYQQFNTFTLFLFLFEYLFSFLSTPGPIFVLYYMAKWNKHVKMAYDTTFKKAVRTYGADNLDEASDNEDIVEDNVTGEKNAQENSNNIDTHTIMVP